MRGLTISIFGVIFLFVTSCSKEKASITASGHVVVVNEGGFHHNDASVSVYDPESRSVVNDLFKAQNGFALGDVAQSMYMDGDTAYIVMNASKAIVVADASQNFQYIRQIAMPAASPRYFLPVSDRKAYVTELYAHKIWILDYRSGTINGTIPVSGWTEQLLSYNGRVYVLEQTAPSEAPVHKLLKVNPSSDQIEQDLDFATDPGSMVIAGDQRIYVLTSRQIDSAQPARLYQVDPSSLSVLHTMDFDLTQSPSYLRYSSFTQQLLFAMNGIYAMTHTDTSLPSQPVVPSDNWNIYGLNANPANGDIYISDAIDYQQASRILRFSKEGNRIDAFNAGIITNGFVFR